MLVLEGRSLVQHGLCGGGGGGSKRPTVVSSRGPMTRAECKANSCRLGTDDLQFARNGKWQGRRLMSPARPRPTLRHLSTRPHTPLPPRALALLAPSWRPGPA